MSDKSRLEAEIERLKALCVKHKIEHRTEEQIAADEERAERRARQSGPPVAEESDVTPAVEGSDANPGNPNGDSDGAEGEQPNPSP